MIRAAEGSTFDRAGDALSALTGLSRIESRGTLRIVLREAGIRADTVGAAGIVAIAAAALPGALAARGVTDASEICRRLVESLGVEARPDRASGDGAASAPAPRDRERAA